MRGFVLLCGVSLAAGVAACDTTTPIIAGLGGNGLDSAGCAPAVTPSSTSVPIGATVTFSVAGCGVASTGWRWRSTNGLVATIDSSSGVAVAVDTGVTTISARAVSDTSIAGAALLTVTP